jgi:hypothetical protein
MHNFGLAFDVVPLDAGKPVWNVSDQQNIPPEKEPTP